METITVKTYSPDFWESPLFNDMKAKAEDLIIEQFTDKMFGFPQALLRAFLRQPDLPERWRLQLDFEGFKKAAAEEFCDRIEDPDFNTRLVDFYEFPEVVSDWLETEAAENIAAEYEKICSQCDEYVFVMGERYRARVDAHLESVVENLVEDMNESIKEFERG